MTTDISVGVRWDPLNGAANGDQPMEGDFEYEYDGGNSSSRLFERSRIRALAGRKYLDIFPRSGSLVLASWIRIRNT